MLSTKIWQFRSGFQSQSQRVLLQQNHKHTVYPKKWAHGFCFAVLCCSYTLTDFPISTRLTSLALWQSNDCPSASKATLMNMDKYFTWIHYERLHNHNKAKHNKTVCIFLGIYCTWNNTETETHLGLFASYNLGFSYIAMTSTTGLVRVQALRRNSHWNSAAAVSSCTKGYHAENLPCNKRWQGRHHTESHRLSE